MVLPGQFHPGCKFPWPAMNLSPGLLSPSMQLLCHMVYPKLDGSCLNSVEVHCVYLGIYYSICPAFPHIVGFSSTVIRLSGTSAVESWPPTVASNPLKSKRNLKGLRIFAFMLLVFLIIPFARVHSRCEGVYRKIN